jgi:uncharacterized RDD family membrane protein YckC
VKLTGGFICDIIASVKTALGVYFRREDYAPFWLRLLVDVIDLLAFGAMCAALAVAVAIVIPVSRSMVNLILLAWLATAFSYFVILKRSRFRTLGYRLGRIKIVGLDGQPPTYFSLSLRLMFGILGPLNWLVDLAWLSGDAHCQALRDKFACTYVVTEKSQPAGQGKVIFSYYDIFFYNFLFREVEVDPTAPRSTSAAVSR